MAEFSWEDNTKEIFDKAVSLPPAPFRKATEKSITEALTSKIGENGTVTEDVLVECIKEVTPKPFLKMGMKKIKPLLKNPQ